MSKLKLFGTFEYYVSINENNLEKLKQYYINMDEEDDYLEKPFGEYKILSTNNGVINLFIRKKGQFIKNVKNIETLDDEVLKYKNTTPDFESMLEEYSKELKDEINEEVKVKIANITDLGFYNFRELYDTNNFVKDVKIYNLDFVYSKEFLNQKDLKEILLSKLHEPGFITRLLNDKYLNRLYRVFLKRNKKEEVDIKDNYFSNFEENKQKFYDVERSKNEDIDFIYENDLKGLLNALLGNDKDNYNLKRHLFTNYIKKDFKFIIPSEIENYKYIYYGLKKGKSRT